MDFRTITCICKQNRKGTQEIRVPFLEHLAPDVADAWGIVLQQYMNGFATGTALHCTVIVLNLWLDGHADRPDQYPLPPIQSDQAAQLIKNLRRKTYGTMVPQRLRLQTVTADWRSFLAAIRQLAIAGLFPTLDWQAVAYRPYKVTHARVSRNQFQGGTLADASMVPGNLDVRSDSYHTELLMPLSIHLNDDAYLRQYERILSRSIEAFYVCAERELRALPECVV